METQSPQEERKGTSYKDTTSGEETTTSTSHLDSQCSDNIGALQHHYNTTTTTTGAQPVTLKTTSKRKKTSWPLAFTTSTFDVKDGECYMLNLPQPRLPTPIVFDGTTPTFPERARELRAYLNICQLSTSTSWTSPTMLSNLLQQASWSSRHQQDIDNIKRLFVLLTHVKTSEMNVLYLQEQMHVETTVSSTTISIRSPVTSMHNKHFRTLLQQEYVVQVNFLVTSSCIRPSRTANQTTYYVDVSEQTSDGTCIGNFDINMLMELVYNNTSYYRALYIHNLDGQRHHNNSRGFRNGYKTSLQTG